MAVPSVCYVCRKKTDKYPEGFENISCVTCVEENSDANHKLCWGCDEVLPRDRFFAWGDHVEDTHYNNLCMTCLGNSVNRLGTPRFEAYFERYQESVHLAEVQMMELFRQLGNYGSEVRIVKAINILFTATLQTPPENTVELLRVDVKRSLSKYRATFLRAPAAQLSKRIAYSALRTRRKHGLFIVGRLWSVFGGFVPALSRTCTRCHSKKPLFEFKKMANGKYAKQCMQCAKRRHEEYHKYKRSHKPKRVPKRHKYNLAKGDPLVCVTCGSRKPAEDFFSEWSGRMTKRCKPCRERQRKYQQKYHDKEKVARA